MSTPVKLTGYQLDQRIAVGGMAEIYRARRIGPEGFSKQVAVKVVLPDLCRDPGFVEMFLQEARLSARLAAEQLVQVFDFGEEGGVYFLVMELVDGVDLATLLSGAGPLPWPLAVHVGRQLCAALSYLHQVEGEEGQPLQIVHRDVTPGNVLVSTRGAIKLGDFGIARWSARQVRTARGDIKGTLAYLSPEQARGDEVDQRTDLYGLGLVLFELVTGQRYLRAEDEPAMLRMAQDPPPRQASVLAPGIPAELDGILSRALDPEPARRFPRAELFDQALAKLSARQGDAASRAALGELVRESKRRLEPPEQASSSEPREPPPRGQGAGADPPLPAAAPVRRTEVVPGAPPSSLLAGRLVKWIAAGGVLALALGGGIWWSSRQGGPGPREAPASGSSRRGGPTRGPDVGSRADGGVTTAGAPRDAAVAGDSPGRVVQRKPRVRGGGRRRSASPGSGASPASPEPRAPGSAAALDGGVAPGGQSADPTVEGPAEGRGAAAPRAAVQPARLVQLRRSLADRGLLPADAPGLHRALAALLAAPGSEGPPASAVEALADRIRSFTVDRPFIEAKLQRMNRRLSASSLSTRQREEVQKLTRRALSLVVSGKYEAANQELNRIDRLLR